MFGLYFLRVGWCHLLLWKLRSLAQFCYERVKFCNSRNLPQSAKSDQGWPRSGNSNYGMNNSEFLNSGIPISISGYMYFKFRYCKVWYVKLLVFLMSVVRSMVFQIQELHTTSMVNFRYSKLLVFQITGAPNLWNSKFCYSRLCCFWQNGQNRGAA